MKFRSLKIKVIKNVFFTILCLALFQCFGSLEVTFFDVGQGNCTLVGSQDRNNPEPPLLIDCGSKSLVKYSKDGIGKKNIQNLIYQKIQKYIKRSREKKLNILISHPDEDHYMWIKDLVEKIVKQYKDIKFTIILGGLSSFYNKEKFISVLQNLGVGDGDIHLYDNNKESTKISDEVFSSKGLFAVLPALYKEKKDDSNASSLVLKVDFHGRNCLLPGDATGETIAHIAKCCRKGELLLDANILLASHHGAKKDGCNNNQLIKNVNPQWVVFSSGFHKGIQHPTGSTVLNYLKYFQSLKTNEEFQLQYHPLYYGMPAGEKQLEHENQRTFALMDNGYGIAVTDKEVYGTLGHGDITFILKQKEAIGPPSFSHGKRYTTIKACVFDALNTAHSFVFENLSMVDFSSLGIDAVRIGSEDFLLMYNIIRLFIDRGHSLKELYFNDNKISDKRIIFYFAVLLRNNKNIIKFEIKNNGLSRKRKKALRKAWANRGLEC